MKDKWDLKEKSSKILAYFISKKDKFKEHYSPERLFEKIGRVSKTAGSKVVYMVLVLYYALLGKEVSLKDKAMVIAALGYFITPFDFLPDMFGLIGFSDDLAVIGYVFKKVYGNLTPEVKERARVKVREWFPEEMKEKREEF